jgi:sodium transport system ATP-binding protein
MIQVSEVTKRFGARSAVRNMSFQAGDAAITGLLGSNGAGKTTTLRMIAGVLQPDEGAIQFSDPKGIGALLDHTGLYSRLTARENLIYFGRLYGLSGATLEQRVEHVLTSLDLADIADRPTARFSQGEHMKVALGRAILHDPRHLLLDEPTNGLDVPTVRLLRALLKSLRDAGVCIVFSSHVMSEVEELCDRVVIIANGSVVADGALAEVRERAAARTLEAAYTHFTTGSTSCRADH